MRRLINSTIVFLLPVMLLAQPLLPRLSKAHGPFWTEAFGSDEWRGSDIGFVVVKHTGMLYVVRQDARLDTVARFRVCAMDTSPGFKERQGDGRTPDGIYRIPLLNSGSSYHLSMRMNYPNAVDDARHVRHTRLARAQWSQGGDIFMHGKCASIGCIAMTDDGIEKLYLLVTSLSISKRENEDKPSMRIFIRHIAVDAEFPARHRLELGSRVTVQHVARVFLP